MQNNLSLVFQPCTPAHIPELVRLCQEEWRHGERPLLPPDVVAEIERQSTFEAYVGDNYRHFTIAQRAGTIVGYAFISENQVVGLGVLPSHKRCGIGSAVMHEAERAILQAGFDAVSVEVYEVNHDARAFYAELGYAEVDRYTSSDYGTPVTTLVLNKALG
jgi:ribosomal protein S18 acetylase RimI-like enzyme